MVWTAPCYRGCEVLWVFTVTLSWNISVLVGSPISMKWYECSSLGFAGFLAKPKLLEDQQDEYKITRRGNIYWKNGVPSLQQTHRHGPVSSLSDVYSSISDNEHVCVTSFIAEWNYCICSEVIWVSQQQRLWNIGGCNLIRTTISSQLVVDPQWRSLTNQKQIWFLPGEDDLFALMRTSHWIQEMIIRQMTRVRFPCLSLRICEFDAEAKANKQLLLCSAYTGLLTVIHGSPTPNVHIWRRMTGFENSFFHPSKSSLHTT